MAKKRGFTLASVMIILALFVSTFALIVVAPATSSMAKETHLIVADILLPTSHDPAVGADVVSRAFANAVYEGLLKYKSGATDLEPCLAESYQVSENGLEYTFTLRKGVKFQDGSEFDAEAVKFSIERLKAINKAPAVYAEDINGVEVLSGNKVKIVLKSINPSFPERLPLIAMVSPKYVKAHEEAGDLGQKYLNLNMKGGTGPFYMDELQPEQHAVLLKNNEYWRGWKGKSIDKIIWRKVKESSTRRLLLEKGDIHISNRLAIDDLVALEKKPNIKVAEGPSFATEYLRMNNKKKPFDDVRVRKAMAYAFDYKGVIKQIMGGRASTLSGPMPSGLFGHNDTLKGYTFDLKKAGNLLKDAGYKPGDIKATYVWLTEVPYSKTIGEVFQSSLKQIGVELKIQEVTWVTLLGMTKSPDTTPDMFDGASGDAPINDPVDFLRKQFHSKSTGGAAWNQNWYVNSKVDTLIDKAAVTLDPKQRAAALKEAQKIVHEEMPQIFMFRSHTLKPMSKKVKGYKIDPLSWGSFNFYDMYLED